MAEENKEERKKIRLQKTSTARLKVVKPNRPVVDGTNPDETVVSEPEEEKSEATEATAPATSKTEAAKDVELQAAVQPAAESAPSAEEEVRPEGKQEAATESTVRPSEPPTGKTNTVQLKVVQQKKKELDDRIKAHSTVKLKVPITAQNEDHSEPSTDTKSLGEGAKTVRITALEAEKEASAAAGETIGIQTTKKPGAEAEGAEGTKKTLKIRRTGGDRTVKLGAAKSEATTRMPTPAQTAERAGVQGLGAEAEAEMDAKAQPGILYTLGSVVTLAACATLLFFLVTQYLTHFSF
jgi:hypothetical protein